MGKKLIFLVYIFSILILFVNPFDAYCSKIKKSDYVESTDRTFENCFYKSESVFEGMPVGNFDVSNSGKLLLCLQHNCINIYDNKGNFEYALSYEIDGSSIAFWQEESIVIYIVRGSTFVLLDENCNVDNVYESTSDVDSELIRKFRNVKEITHEGISYNLSGVKKLTRTDSESEKIIYTYHSDYSTIIMIILIGISVIIIEFITKKCK